MKKWVALAILALTVPQVLADETREDYYFEDRENKWRGEEQDGYIQPDWYRPDWYGVFDKDGNREGTWRRDWYFEDRWIFEKED